ELGLNPLELLLELGVALLQVLAERALLLARLPALHFAREFVAPLLHRLLLGDQRAPRLVQAHERIEVQLHAAVAAVLPDQLEVLGGEAPMWDALLLYDAPDGSG